MNQAKCPPSCPACAEEREGKLSAVQAALVGIAVAAAVLFVLGFIAPQARAEGLNCEGMARPTDRALCEKSRAERSEGCQVVGGDAIAIIIAKHALAEQGYAANEARDAIKASIDASASREDREQVLYVIDQAFEWHGGDMIDFAVAVFEACMAGGLHPYAK